MDLANEEKQVRSAPDLSTGVFELLRIRRGGFCDFKVVRYLFDLRFLNPDKGLVVV